jgi:hypothetical protein
MAVLTKLRANPGGQLSPAEVIGRDKQIGRLWGILERQSLVLSAERRMGKTCVVKKMMAEAPSDMLLIYHDLEGLRSPLEFVETVFQDVEGYLSGLQRTAKRTHQFLKQLNGAEFSGFKLPNIAASHWKTLLTKTLEDLIEHQERTLIFFWDEMPMMLDNIKQDSGEKVAMEVLDTLRSLRQMSGNQSSSKLRMVFTGSIGLHHVISSLKQAGYANAPTNDMYIEELPPLSLTDAQKLALKLLAGEEIPTDDIQGTAKAIAKAVDGIPYYIHHVVDRLKWTYGKANPAIISKFVDACLTDSLDRWDMSHYRQRIDVYYESDKRPFVLNLLDILAVANQPLQSNDLFNRLKSHVETEDSEMVRDVLTLLQRDHYVIQKSDGYRFRFPLIGRYWRLHRGLAA